MEVVPLRKTVDEAAVKACEELLAQAKCGNITSLVYICGRPNGSHSHALAGHTDFYAALAEIERMKHLVMKSIDDSVIDEDPSDFIDEPDE